jgi:hypothetical protein
MVRAGLGTDVLNARVFQDIHLLLLHSTSDLAILIHRRSSNFVEKTMGRNCGQAETNYSQSLGSGSVEYETFGTTHPEGDIQQAS